MPRSRRTAPTGPFGPTVQRRGTLDDLAALRGRIEATSIPHKTTKTGRESPLANRRKVPEPANARADTQDMESSSELLRAELRDVKPLPSKRQRQEIDTLKPAPIPRPSAPAQEDKAAVAPRHREPPTDGSELFRFTMDGVIPIPDTNRAEIGIDRTSARHGKRANAPRLSDEELLRLPSAPDTLAPAELFRYAVRGTIPVTTRNRAEISPPAPTPTPLKREEDEREALRESLEAPLRLEDRLDIGDETVFLRPGLPRRVLADLRRGRWVLQGQVDLHGFNRDEARDELSRFLATSLQQGRRCVRVIHGKGLGSPGKESILKHLSRGWLAQREEILAFCQAGPHDGGSGALLVLLRAGKSSPK